MRLELLTMLRKNMTTVALLPTFTIVHREFSTGTKGIIIHMGWIVWKLILTYKF
jgi:hypothetical protein